MSNSFVKLLVSQLFANLADIFFRVTIIANIYISYLGQGQGSFIYNEF